MKTAFFSMLLVLTSILYAQESNTIEQELSINKNIDGVLLMPKTEKPPLVILLSGSGPNDRDGNSNLVKGNMLKKLAQQLSLNGIASYRYDKRSSKYVKERNPAVNTMIFDAFIEDASACIDFFNKQDRFGKIYILGHSQGSLVGMVAAKDKIDGFISLAGPGTSIDETITEQIHLSAPQFTEDTKRVFKILKSGKTTDSFPMALASVFNKQIQPFMMSWMKYNPKVEIQKLNMPILIINGTNDIQVKEEDANILHNASPKSQLKIIENMNHALVIYEGKDNLGNMKSYNEINRSLSTDLITALASFINQ